jgi:cardiolipin synthase
MSWQVALSAVEIAWLVGASCWILLEKRSPTATLAWIFGMALLPLVGFFVYFFLGPRRLERKRLKRLRAISAVRERAGDLMPSIAAPDRKRIAQLMRLAAQADGLPAGTARSLTLYEDGVATFDAIVEAIARAEHHVHLEYYIFEPDVTGTRIRDALVERARAGVEVRLLVDAIGSPRLKKKFLAPLLAAGGQVAFFNRLKLGRLLLGRRWMNFRTHRKIVVVDGRIGFTGGINVHDEENRAVRGADAWRDTHVRIEGAVVRGLQRVFLEDWHFSTDSAPMTREYFPDEPSGSHAVQIVVSGPDSDALTIAKVYFAAIALARHRVWVTTPYFVPEDALVAALVTAAGRGVDVQLLLSTRSDSRWVDAAGRSYFEGLIGAGVKIHLYGPPMIHAKTFVVDEEIAMVGTANVDSRSLRLNFEVMAVIYDAAFTEQLAAAFRADLGHAKRVSRRDTREPLPARLFEAVARLFAPQL